MLALVGNEAAMDFMPTHHDYNACSDGGGSYIINFADRKSVV